MKTQIIIISLIFTLGLKAQEKAKIYYDNRDNSVVNFLSQPKVSPILSENPMFGFSTVNFSVSKEGKIISISNLLESDDVFFKTAKDAIEKSSGRWIIKPGVIEQTFQITFYLISDRMDSLRKAHRPITELKTSLSQYIKYNNAPLELTLLPTINIVFKEKVVIKKIVDSF